MGALRREQKEDAVQKSEHGGGIYHSSVRVEPMKNDRSKAPLDARSPLSWMGGLARRWEERAQRLLTEINARGETRLEEISRRIRQSDAWLRLVDVSARMEERRNAVRERWAKLGAMALERVGIASAAQVAQLDEKLRMMSWRLERMARKIQENPQDEKVEAEAESDIRSLA